MDTMEHSWPLPDEPIAPGLARQHVARVCIDLSRELYEVATLLTSELVTSVIDSGGGELELRLTTEADRIHVEVVQHDGVDSLVGPKGRGLMLVERLSTRWGVEDADSAGHRMWFDLETA